MTVLQTWNRHPVIQRSQACVLLLVALGLLAVAPAQGQAVTFGQSFVPATIGPGSSSTLQYVIGNGDDGPAANLAFTNEFPEGLTLASAANPQVDCDARVDAPDGGSSVAVTLERLGELETCTITVSVTASTTVTNPGVELTFDDEGSTESNPATLTVDTGRPGFFKSFAPDSMPPGQVSTLTFTIDNTQNTANVTGFSFSDQLPPGLVIATPTNAFTDCPFPNFTATAGSSSLNLFSQGILNAGATCTARVDVVAASAGSYINTSSELAAFNGQSSGFATDVLAVVRDVLVKQFTDDPVTPGGTVTLAFTLTNFDRANTATNISFTDDLDATLSGLVALDTPLIDACGSGSELTGTSVLALTGGTLGPEASCTFEVTLQVPAAAPPGHHPNTTSSVSFVRGGDGVRGKPATDVLVVANAPELSKTFVPDTASPGDAVTMEFTVTNTSAFLPLDEIAFTDNIAAFLPGILPALEEAGFCGPGAIMFLQQVSGQETLTVQGASLDPGASCTFGVTFDVPLEVSSGTYTNTTSTIQGRLEDGNVEGFPATDDLVVVSPPTLLKTFDVAAKAGDTVPLTFTLVHDENAPAAATAIAFSDDLGSVLAGLEAVDTPLSDVCGPGSSLTGTDDLMFTGGTLDANTSCSFTVTVAVPEGTLPGSYTNTTSNVTATVNDLEVTGAPASDDLEVIALVASKAFTDDPVLPGKTVSLEFTLEHDASSPGTATEIFFTDDLSDVLPGLTTTATLPLNDICGDGSSLDGTPSFLVFAGGSLAVGETCTFTVEVLVPEDATPGTYVNITSAITATINEVPAVLDPAVDRLEVADPTSSLAMNKTFLDDPVFPGDNVVLEFAIGFDGPGDATSIAFTDDLEAVLPGLAALDTPLSDVCGPGSMLDGTSMLELTGGTLAPGGTCTFSVTLGVPADASEGAYTNTTSPLAADVLDETISGDPATDILDIGRPPEALLSILKMVDAPAVNVGEEVTFTVGVDNDGDAVTGVEVMDMLPPELTFVDAIPSQGTYDEGTGLWTVGDLPLQGQATLELVAVVAEVGVAINTATLTASVPADNTPENNSDEATVRGRGAFLEVTKTVNADTVPVGTDVVFTVTVTNAGEDVTEIVILDLLPAELAFVEATASQGTYDDGTGLWAVGDLAETGSATLAITATVEAEGEITNTATLIDSNPPDLDDENNSASATVVGEPTTPDLTITITPAREPVIVPPQGANVRFLMEVANNTATDQLVDIWGQVTGEGVDRFFGPRSTTVAANTVLSRIGRLRVPGGADPGNYRFDAFVGTFPDGAVDSDGFDFEKIVAGPEYLDTSNWEVDFGLRPEDEALVRSTSVERLDADVPAVFSLSQNYPNPFNPVTVIRFGVPETSAVQLTVYDLMGREVMRLFDATAEAGMHAVTFRAADLPSGIYLYRLQTPRQQFTRTMLLLK